MISRSDLSERLAKVWHRSEPSIEDRVLQLAGGDIDLAQEAIRASIRSDGSCDLGRIVDYLVRKRVDRAATAT